MKEIEELDENSNFFNDLNYANKNFDMYMVTVAEASEDIQYLLDVKERMEKENKTFKEARKNWLDEVFYPKMEARFN